MNGISSRIKQMRLDLNMSQVDLAKILGVTNAHISAIEKGKTMPSNALIKLICKEFKISERWLLDGLLPIESDELEYQTEHVMIDITDRLNKIRTRDNMPIRSRIVQIEELFVDILDIEGIIKNEELKANYYDLCYKTLYHLNTYLKFQKKTIKGNQLHVFSFPDDIADMMKQDINQFDLFFAEAIADDN